MIQGRLQRKQFVRGGWRQAFCVGHAEFEMLLDIYVSTEI